MMCTGFWVGLLSSIFFDCSIMYQAIGGDRSPIWFHLFDGALISGLVWFIYLIQLNIEKNVSDQL